MIVPRTTANGQCGFTLIEVVVALAILGTGLVILLETHYASLRLLDEAQQEVFIASLLESVVGEAEKEILLGNQTGDGEFGRRYPEYSYSFEGIQPDKDNVPGLFEVVVTVRGPSVQRDVTFYLYDASQLTEEGESGLSGGSDDR
jgi:prepilin-type N-terminal cleavage/methylation domain-containing protein